MEKMPLGASLNRAVRSVKAAGECMVESMVAATLVEIQLGTVRTDEDVFDLVTQQIGQSLDECFLCAWALPGGRYPSGRLYTSDEFVMAAGVENLTAAVLAHPKVAQHVKVDP